ncbi:uncharacterized protein [Amphiura filiformis]|uniref:uncharacterized protein isoform X3 n=1 Tax=Amphiura filiformis TaxID=82378 RepID=UPI003B22305F
MWTNYMDKMYNWIYKMEYIIVLMVLLTFSGTYVLGQQEFEQSSTVVAGNDEQIADYAMDGQTRTCSETQLESDPWWRVRLEQEYHVTAIKITKNARKADELQGAEFRVGSCTAENGLSDNNTLCGTINNQGQAPTITLNCQGSTYGQYLFVNHRGNNKIISLCEVELTTTEVPANQKSMVSFSSASYQVVESAGSLDIEVARSGRTSSCLSVALATSPDSASSGSDFVPTEEVLEFAADEITKTVTITIIPDTMDEGTESFTVKLANIIGGELGDIPEANVQILESLPTTMQATTPNVPTTPVAPTTSPAIPTTASAVPTTSAAVPPTTPALPTTPNIPTTVIATTTDKANPSTSEAIVVTTSPTTLALTSKSVTTMEQITTPTMHVTTMNNPTTQLTTNVKKTTDRSETTTTLTTQATSEKTHSVEMTSSVLETSSHIVDDFCPMETTIVNGYVLTWPESVANVEVGSVEKCANESSQAGDSLGKRLCLNLDGTGAQWREPTLHSCTYRMDINIQLAEIAKLTITPDNVEEVSSDLAAITSESDDLHSEGLYSLLEILEHIVDNTTYTSVEVAAYVLETVDNIHEVDEDEIREAERGNETISNILVIFETLVERVRENGNNLTYTGEHLSVEIKQLPREAFDDGLTWKPAEDEEGSGNKRDEKEEEATIHIPESVLEFITNETIGVSFVIYDNSLLFQLPHVTKEEGDEDKELRRQIGKVISATVSDTKIVGLPLQDPVVTTFTIPDNTNDRNEVPFDKSLLQCVYWDFAADNGDGDWSTTGCQLVSLEDNNEAVCHCIHLTNFAIILDARGGTHDLVLELISKIGCAISIAALIITILTYLNIRKLRDKQPQRILIHLSFSLLGLYVVFLIGIEQTHWKHGCTAVAGLMHYFTLTSISWMAVEAINMYYVFIQVMNSQVSRFMLKASIFAWGLPLLIVGLIVGLDHTHYVNEHHCFLPPGIVFSFGIVFYIVLVLLFNFVIFFMVMQRLTCGRKSKRTNKKMARETWKRLQNAVTISVLLGLTWIFGFFTIIDSAVFELQLVFCIFNSLQGLFIFLLFCVRPKEVRFAWRAWFSGSTIRRFSMSSYLSNTRKRTSSSGSSGTIRNRLSSGLTGLYRTRDSKGNLTKLNLGEIHHQNDKSVANSLPVVDNDYKRFSTFKEDEHSINEEAKTENETVINDMNVDETLNEENVQVMDDNVQLTQEEDGKEEEVEEEERVSLDSGIPNGTIVEDYDGKETLIVYV